MNAERSFRDRLEHRLTRLDSLDLRRRLNPLDGSMGPVIQRDGRRFINFSSNDYLGLASHPEVWSALGDALGKEGVGSGGSRLVCGDRPALHELEEDLAAWKGRDEAMVFGSGYLTSLGVIRAVTTGRDLVLLDDLAHRSLIEGARLSEAEVGRFEHNDPEDLNDQLQDERERFDAVLVVTEGIFSMKGDRAPLERLRSITRRYDAWLFVDEAHSAGVCGPVGAGLTADLEDPPELTMGTLSKAVGTYGGYVVGNKPLKDFLTNRATPAIYSTALPAALVEATRTALDLLRSDDSGRETLRRHVDRVAGFLDERDLPRPDPASQIVPILTGSTESTLSAAAILRNEGLDAVPIRPPTVPRSRGRIRISLRADHTKKHLDRLLEGLKNLERKGLLIQTGSQD